MIIAVIESFCIMSMLFSVMYLNFRMGFHKEDSLVSRDSEHWEDVKKVLVLEVGREKYLLKNDHCLFSMKKNDAHDAFRRFK